VTLRLLALLAAVTLKTGPEIGARIPNFEAPDQNGRTQTFASLRGPKGLVLMFVRSADW
jgi:peroxiredoxin